MSDQPGVSSTIDANPAPFFQALDRVLAGTKSTFGHVESQISSITGPIGTVMGKFNMLAGLLGGGAVFKKAIAETVELTKDSMQLGRALGVSAQTGSTWIAALEDVNASTDDLGAASKGLLKNLRDNEQGLNSLGLVTRDASGQLRGMDQIMLDGIKTVNGYKEGTDRNLAAQQVFGKGISGSSQLLLLNSETIAENKQLQEELGLVVGEQNVEAYKKYDNAMDGAQLALKTMWVTVGQQLMPIFTQLANWFKDIAPAAIVVLKGALGGIVTVFHGIILVINILWELFRAAFKNMAALGRGFADMMTALFKGDFAGAGRAVAGFWNEYKLNVANAMDAIVRKAQETKDNIASIWGVGSEEGAVAPPAPEGKSFKVKPQKDDSSKLEFNASKSRLEIAQRELAELSKYLDEQTALENSAAGHVRELGLKQLDAKADVLHRMAEAGEISRADEIAGLRDLEERRYEIERQALQRRIDDISLEKMERQKANQDMELLEVEHDRKLAELQAQQTMLRTKTWKNIFGSMQSGFQGVLAQFGRGTMTIGNLFRGLMGAMLDAVTNTLAAIAAKWLAAKVMQLLFSKATIAGKAAEAGAAGTASFAGAPWPINIGAPAFGAAMAAVAASYMAMPSAAGGWDVPRGVNPLTQLHSGEMVLPERLSDVVRGVADGGGRAGSGDTYSIRRAGPGQLLVQERDLMRIFRKLGMQNYRLV